MYGEKRTSKGYGQEAGNGRCSFEVSSIYSSTVGFGYIQARKPNTMVAMWDLERIQL